MILHLNWASKKKTKKTFAAYIKSILAFVCLYVCTGV